LRKSIRKVAAPGQEKGGVLAPEIIDLRRLGAGEIKPLLEAESREWEAKLRWNYTSAARLISSSLEEKRLSGYALLSAGRITGYSFFFYEDAKGLIGNLFVGSEGSRLDGAQILLDHVIETMLATPGLCRVETQLPHFSLKELDARFRAQGFKGFLRRFMVVSLSGRRPHPQGSDAENTEKQALPEDVVVEPWDRKHDRQAARLLFEVYRDHVDAKINDHYRSFDGSTRLVENIVRHWGCGEHLPGASLVAAKTCWRPGHDGRPGQDRSYSPDRHRLGIPGAGSWDGDDGYVVWCFGESRLRRGHPHRNGQEFRRRQALRAVGIPDF
jgi:hypothetical protein